MNRNTMILMGFMFSAIMLYFFVDRYCDFREKVMEWHIKKLQYDFGETEDEPDPLNEI